MLVKSKYIKKEVVNMKKKLISLLMMWIFWRVLQHQQIKGEKEDE